MAKRSSRCSQSPSRRGTVEQDTVMPLLEADSCNFADDSDSCLCYPDSASDIGPDLDSASTTTELGSPSPVPRFRVTRFSPRERRFFPSRKRSVSPPPCMRTLSTSTADEEIVHTRHRVRSDRRGDHDRGYWTTEQMRRRHERELAVLRHQHQSEIDIIISDHEHEVGRLRQRYEDEWRGMRRRVEQLMEEIMEAVQSFY